MQMVHPSYQLNPGDMFQVDPEKVLYGTGVQKAAKQTEIFNSGLERRAKLEKLREEKLLEKRQTLAAKAATKAAAKGAAEDASASTDAGTDEADSAKASEPENVAEQEEAEVKPLNDHDRFVLDNAKIKTLLHRVKQMLKDDIQDFSAKQKKDLRFFRAAAQRFLSLPEGTSAQELLDSLQLQLATTKVWQDEWLAKRGIAVSNEDSADGPVFNTTRQTDKALESLTEAQKAKAMKVIGGARMSREEMRNLAKLIRMDEQNPFDETKPYATPWRPRPYMSAFAFVPRYLEVNFDVCAAVYLRHPVARKGMAEVPTPFSYLTSQLAHNWYLERGPRERA